MKIAIIEDELPAAEKLSRYLMKYRADLEILHTMRSINESVEWLKANQPKVDLIFMDIQLTDGLSFEIFSAVEVVKPVIFTTAHDEYAIDAFQVNGIAYLLKPVTFVALSNAMNKFQSLKAQFEGTATPAADISKAAAQIAAKSYKDRFLVRIGDHIHSLKTQDAALFYAEGRTVYLVTNEGRRYIIEYKLEALEEILPPEKFYRVNRTFIVHLESIADVLVYSNSRLKVSMKIATDKEIIVSRDKVGAFKAWFEGK